MQTTAQRQKLSRHRAALLKLLAELKRILQPAFGREVLVKGNVYELARKCGKPSCACTRGQLHRSMVLSWSQQGKTRLWSIPTGQLETIRQKSEAYLRFRQTRARVGEIYQQMLVHLDRIEELRREEV